MSIEVPSGDPEIIEAEEGDLEPIARLFRSTFEATYPTFPKLHSAEEDLAHFKTVLERNRVLTVKVNGKVVTYCAFGGGWITDLYVDPAHQRQGYGTNLLSEAKASSSELQLWTFQENENARRFYEDNGFVAVEMTDGEGNEERKPDIRYVCMEKFRKSPRD